MYVCALGGGVGWGLGTRGEGVGEGGGQAGWAGSVRPAREVEPCCAGRDLRQLPAPCLLRPRGLGASC